jgi:hypothetical protein
MTEQTITYTHNGVVATVTTDEPDGPAVISWDDGVANEWTEQYTFASAALARLALLAACAETEWARGFHDSDPESFADSWTVTLRGMLSTPLADAARGPVPTPLPSVDYLELVGFPWDGYTLVSWQDVAEHLRKRIDAPAERLVESHGATTMEEARAVILGEDEPTRRLAERD